MDLSEIMPIAYCNDIEVLRLTQTACKYVNEQGIAGVFVEAGTAWGAHGCIMSEFKRPVHLFDSFDGIPEYDERDIEFTQSWGASGGDKRTSSGITVCKLEDVRMTMERYIPLNNINFHKGWFCDTLPRFKEKISVLRLDCDIYHSYMDCFKYLLPLLEPGGILIIDDFCLTGCQQAMKESGLDIDKFNKFNNIAWVIHTRQSN